MFDDHGADGQTRLFGETALGAGKALVVDLSQFIPGNTFTHFDPAVTFIERRLEGPVKFCQGELPVTLSSDIIGAHFLKEWACFSCTMIPLSGRVPQKNQYVILFEQNLL